MHFKIKKSSTEMVERSSLPAAHPPVEPTLRGDGVILEAVRRALHQKFSSLRLLKFSPVERYFSMTGF